MIQSKIAANDAKFSESLEENFVRMWWTFEVSKCGGVVVTERDSIRVLFLAAIFFLFIRNTLNNRSENL